MRNLSLAGRGTTDRMCYAIITSSRGHIPSTKPPFWQVTRDLYGPSRFQLFSGRFLTRLTVSLDAFLSQEMADYNLALFTVLSDFVNL